MQWCAMSIFLFLKLYNFINFYNFIKGIMCICTVFLKHVRPMFVYLLTCWNICNRTVYLYLIKLASKVWKKNCPSFLYTLYKAWKSRSQHFPFILDRFSFVCNATNFFIHSLKRFVLYLRLAGFLQSSALYATTTHDPRSKYNWQKSEH